MKSTSMTNYASANPRSIDNLMLGYCMNVHPCNDLNSLIDNLSCFAAPIQNQVSTLAERKSIKLGIGLWLSEAVVEQLQVTSQFNALQQCLLQHNLVPHTLNGFPQRNFHQRVVKHQVYQPTWWQAERLTYTQALANLLARLLPEHAVGSISTLPLAWSSPTLSLQQYQQATANLHTMAVSLQHIFEQTGRKILLSIEPEPGCAIGDSLSMRDFFERYLFDGPYAEVARQYLTVCHDICHAAVMRENQLQRLQEYRESGIRIGKVQVSSAIHVNWDALDASQRKEAFEQVAAFAEDRYLHQTTMRSRTSGSIQFIEDLSQLVANVSEPEKLIGNWTIHFHVPIHISRFGHLATTQSAIDEMISALTSLSDKSATTKMPSSTLHNKEFDCEQGDAPFFSGHFEIETYAWSVLANKFRREDLVSDIVDEFRYLLPKLSQFVS